MSIAKLLAVIHAESKRTDEPGRDLLMDAYQAALTLTQRLKAELGQRAGAAMQNRPYPPQNTP